MAMTAIGYCHGDYTVAWLCALPLEMAAAEAMLDEKHPNLPTKSTDDNTYILGKVCDHNVVIACLRSGVYGTTSAAISATQMQSTFKSIRFFLMVGIGGGAPSNKADIWLGDVVVSKPTREFGGVIQYDYGKTITGGRFERTGLLNKPLPVLLTAVSRLESAHRSSPSRISALVSEMVERHPIMAGRFTHRGRDQDQLFDSEYVHCDPEITCDHCDTRRLVIRPPRVGCDPVIHYGLIASGNQVMKDAHTRDILARELGILCFEMEAAGLMDDFQCLVIRGICDYSDSHKHKQWQEYAATTAAAYAKELLSVVHTVQVVDAPLACSDKVLYYSGRLCSGRERTADMMLCRNDIEDPGVPLSKISSYDHERVHERLLQKRLVGTTQWFLDHSDFKAWFTEKTIPSLWCSGKIGSGKTMIATTAVEAAMYRYSGNCSPTVFLYCENDYRETLDAAYILSSFIRQLCEFLCLSARPFPEHVLTRIRKFFGPERTQPDLTDLKHIFILFFKYVPDTIYIIDGLDALDRKHSKSLLEFIQHLCSSRNSGQSRFLLFSRDQIPGYINIATFIPGICQISTSTNVMPDINVYINTSIADKTLYRKLTDNGVLLEDVKQTLLTKSLGMFLWVYLQLEILWDTCQTDAEIRSALATLPKGLEETYGRCIDRISPRDKYALKVLKWVGFAIRPLHIDEMKEAVAFNLEDTKWNTERMPQKNILLGCCANLVIMDYSDYCVRFAHYSVKQYLEKHLGNKGHPYSSFSYPTAEQGDLECGELFITYLSFSDFSLQLTKHSMKSIAVSVPPPALLARQALFCHVGIVERLFSRTRTQNRHISVLFRTIRTPSTPDQTRYKFLSYAVTNWALHTKTLPNTSLAWEKFKILATSFNETWNFHPWLSGGRSMESLLHGLFGWAVKEQHEALLSIVLAAGPSLQQICNLPLVGESHPALHIASKLGHQRIIQILLGFCDANVRDREGYTALHHAASAGHTEICQLLLTIKEVGVDASSGSQCTPLWLAASNGHDEVVSLLYEQGSELEAKNGFRSTPLSQASQNGHYAVACVLLEKGADLESPDTDGRTPLSFAALQGHEAIVKLLLDRGADVESRNEINGPSPISLAANHGHEAVVKFLLDRGAWLESKDETNHLTPLSRAASQGHEAVVKLLLDRGAELESQDRICGQTALLWAAEKGHEAVVKLLLDKGANVETRDKGSQTPLSRAALQGHQPMVKLLLDWGAELESRDRMCGQTALSWAAEKGHEAVVKLLLDRGADPEPTDLLDRTPLSWAAENGHEAVVKLLLDRGADPEPTGILDRTPLSWAAENGHAGIVKLLLDRGVDQEFKDTCNKTPLLWAAASGHEEVVKLLLDRGADPESRDIGNHTPLLWAVHKGHKAIVNILRDCQRTWPLPANGPATPQLVL